MIHETLFIHNKSKIEWLVFVLSRSYWSIAWYHLSFQQLKTSSCKPHFLIKASVSKSSSAFTFLLLHSNWLALWCSCSATLNNQRQIKIPRKLLITRSSLSNEARFFVLFVSIQVYNEAPSSYGFFLKLS